MVRLNSWVNIVGAFEWRGQYETEDEVLNLDHKQLFKALNDCLELAAGGAGKQDLLQMLNVIRESLAIHFENEEHIAGWITATSADKKNFDQLKQQHDDLLADLNILISAYSVSEDKSMSVQEILVFLHDWTVNHIRNEDRKLVR
jgi:hemerythrin-like metal-binding protein